MKHEAISKKNMAEGILEKNADFLKSYLNYYQLNEFDFKGFTEGFSKKTPEEFLNTLPKKSPKLLLYQGTFVGDTKTVTDRISLKLPQE